jgi:sortase A
VDEIVVSGVGVGELRNGPGHYPQTPLPGELGNAALAGHRTTYGAPFYDIDSLIPGDEIIATTYAGRFVYRVTGATVVEPSDVSVLAAVPDYRLTLTTCHPKYTARKRLVVTAELDVNASSPVTGAPPAQGESVPNTTIPELAQAMIATATPPTPTARANTSALPTSAVSTTVPPIEADATATRPEPTSVIDDSIGGGWFDDNAAWPHVIVWGLLCLAVAAAASRFGRSTGRRCLGLLAGFVPFIVFLYFFYENVNRLVPTGL